MANLILTMGYYACDVTDIKTSPRRGFCFSGARIRGPFLFQASRESSTPCFVDKSIP
ncbi:hypothetical protein BZZ87_004455 [Salmonella enterica subsp. enterica serovar 4,[5],12:b:-]|nr:hypothetical protein [Salmonella enterica subsp. enterica serovar 4,[5],12:b:-]